MIIIIWTRPNSMALVLGTLCTGSLMFSLKSDNGWSRIRTPSILLVQHRGQLPNPGCQPLDARRDTCERWWHVAVAQCRHRRGTLLPPVPGGNRRLRTHRPLDLYPRGDWRATELCDSHADNNAQPGRPTMVVHLSSRREREALRPSRAETLPTIAGQVLWLPSLLSTRLR